MRVTVTDSIVEEASGVSVSVAVRDQEAIAFPYTPLVIRCRLRPMTLGLRVALHDRSTILLLCQLYTPECVNVMIPVRVARMEFDLLAEGSHFVEECKNVAVSV